MTSATFKSLYMEMSILGDPGADGRGERQIKRAKSVRAEAWTQKIQCLKICAQSEVRTQIGSGTSPLKVSSQGLSRPSGKLLLAPGFSSH